MSERNLIYVHKIGESGTILTATLSDRDGAINLSAWTITLNVKKNGTAYVTNAACVAAGDQVANKGVLTCTLSVAADVFTKDENYDAEFKLVNGSTVHYYPKNKDNKRTYFTFEVQKSLGET